MKVIKSKLAKLAPFFKSAMVVLIASFFVMSVVYAATTIGTNISTGGTIQAEGNYASTTGFIVIGKGLGTVSPATGDLFVSGKATTTAALTIGAPTVPVVNFDFTGGDLAVQGVAFIQSNATTSGNLSVGGFASTTGYLKVGGGVFDLSTTTATTTKGIFSRDETSSTSTISIGDITTGAAKKQVGCLELAGNNGAYYSCFINPGADADAMLVCTAGRCN